MKRALLVVAFVGGCDSSRILVNRDNVPVDVEVRDEDPLHIELVGDEASLTIDLSLPSDLAAMDGEVDVTTLAPTLLLDAATRHATVAGDVEEVAGTVTFAQRGGSTQVDLDLTGWAYEPSGANHRVTVRASGKSE